jgi:hypothetical protein
VLAIERERLLDRLLALKAVTDLYEARDPDFPAASVAWLEETSQALGKLRHPLASLAVAEKGRLLAAADGLREPDVRGEKTTHRQAQRAGAAVALARTEARLRDALERVNATLAGYEEQIANLVAYAASKQPLPQQGDRLREVWLREIWRALAVDGDGRTAQTQLFLASRLTWLDRLYVLGNVVDKLFDAPT